MSQVQQIKEAVSIAQIIGERVPLASMGRHLRCCCPFHGEKTPSFYVTEDLGYYKCFGCGKAGDVFTFLEEYEGMSFREALEYLAERTGIKLESNFAHKGQDEEKQILLNILSESAAWYQKMLERNEGKAANDYLAERKINAQTRRLFGLGASGNSWDELTKFLRGEKKFREEELIKSGMIIKSKNGRLFDRFRGRLMFPLKNHRGQVVGFSGRWLGKEDEKEAKYINSPETSLYHKSELLFGLAENLPAIRKEGAIVLVEGEFDVMSSAQAKVNNVAAIKGSALTAEHVKLLKRYVNRVILALDMDKSGIEATRKAAALLQREEIELRVAEIAEGKDPDELAKESPLVWREAVKKSLSVYDYFLLVLQKKHNINTIEGKKKMVSEMAGFIHQMENAIERDYYSKKLAEIIKVRQSVLESDLAMLKRKADATISSVRTVVKPVDNKGEKQPSKKELWLLWLLFNSSSEGMKKKKSDLRANMPKWTLGRDRVLVEKLMENKKEYRLKDFGRDLADDLRERLGEITMNRDFARGSEKIEIDEEWEKEWRGALLKKKQKLLKELVKKLEETQDEEEKQKLLAECAKLTKELTKAA